MWTRASAFSPPPLYVSPYGVAPFVSTPAPLLLAIGPVLNYRCILRSFPASITTRPRQKLANQTCRASVSHSTTWRDFSRHPRDLFSFQRERDLATYNVVSSPPVIFLFLFPKCQRGKWNVSKTDATRREERRFLRFPRELVVSLSLRLDIYESRTI